jgi:hypothetical protein
MVNMVAANTELIFPRDPLVVKLRAAPPFSSRSLQLSSRKRLA